MNFLSAFILALSLSACATDVKPMNAYEKKLQWLNAADAQTDAKQAIKKGDYRLMGLAQRGIVVPSVEAAKSEMYQKKCGVNVMDGVTDFITSDEHGRLMRKARSYAKTYNAIIKSYCEP